ncbi:uncharacterized protein LOC141660206 [Apium graveolens]|uniref:uncharacterized protein LOC141660206 n=1 Tax=Apium graveolens TaxID=4045 RepID=UPI003D7A0A65
MESSKVKECSFGLSFPMLTKTNYIAWSLKMKVFMQAHGVWDAIEPKEATTTVEDKVDIRAMTIIYRGIAEDLLLSIADKKTSKEAWDAIKTVHLCADNVKNAKVQTLKSEFEALTVKDTEQLDDFCMRLNGFVANIRTLGEEIEEEYMVKKIRACGHYAAGFRKPRRENEQTHEANLAQVNNDELTLLLAKCRGANDEIILLHEGGVSPKINKVGLEGQRDAIVWYLDNGASNHMIGYRLKFTKLDEGVRGKVNFGDGSTVEIHGK